jgi:zinc transport system ATP-binding protein
VKVLEKAGFHIHQGEFVALVGPNGSGKTTALKLLLGLEKPREGIVEILGKDGAVLSRDRIGYVPQMAVLDRDFPITVRNVVRMGRLAPARRARFAEADIAEAMSQAEISDLAERSYAGLSGGQRRRVLVARALAARPEILILDEPTANMDAESEDRLFGTLGKLKGSTTILIVTHNREFVSPLVDRALCMGSREAGDYRIVQHRVGAAEAGDLPDGAVSTSRILHGETIPGDLCEPPEEPDE